MVIRSLSDEESEWFTIFLVYLASNELLKGSTTSGAIGKIKLDLIPLLFVNFMILGPGISSF